MSILMLTHPLSGERLLTLQSVAQAFLNSGSKVQVFLHSDGVYLAHNALRKSEAVAAFQDFAETALRLTWYVCSTSALQRGIDSDMHESCEVSGLASFFLGTQKADNMVVF